MEKRGGGRCKPRFRRREVEKGVGRSEVEKGSWETGGGKGGLEREVGKRGGVRSRPRFLLIFINTARCIHITYIQYIHTMHS